MMATGLERGEVGGGHMFHSRDWDTLYSRLWHRVELTDVSRKYLKTPGYTKEMEAQIFPERR